MSEQLDAFRAGYLAANASFCAHDFDATFTGFGESVEWHPMEQWRALGVLGKELLRGRDEIMAAYRELLDEFPDWGSEATDFVEVSDRVFVVRAVASGRGRASGTPVRVAFSQVWELSEDGTPDRVREYADHGEALGAARASA